MARLRNVDRYFVRAQQIDFPFAAKTVAGPFETNIEAWDEIARIRKAGEHPGCQITRYCKRVPIADAHPKEPAA